MSKYREIRGSLQGERCEHKSWADLCEKCEIDRLRAENERLREALREYECHCPTSVCEWFPCGRTARAALEEKQ